MPKEGEKPGAGTYRCYLCGLDVTLKKDADELPTCPSCNYKEFIKVK